jgi:ribosomal protein S18 acetylase RimI-like enzyme
MSAITITPYARRFRRSVTNLLFYSYRTHTHLDWQDTESWLDSTDAPMCLAWQDNTLIGLMAASAPVQNTCWMRLAALADDLSAAQTVFTTLWERLALALRMMGVQQVAVLVIRDWLKPYLPPLGFRFDEYVVTLFRSGYQVPDAPLVEGLAMQSTIAADIQRLLEIDHAAFPPLWRMSSSDFREARRSASLCTLALKDEVAAGYQLWTQSREGAHLARLAVRPEMQGNGIGAALVVDALQRFARRSVYTMTVNTQASNHHSQRLYTRCGFQRNGYDLPVYLANLSANTNDESA